MTENDDGKKNERERASLIPICVCVSPSDDEY